MLRVRNLRTGYGSLEVVKGVSFHVAGGEIVALIGANGAGKTSLLNAVVGLLPPWQGDVRIDGRTVTGAPAWRAVTAGAVLVPEGRQIFPDMTVLENLVIGGYHNRERLRQPGGTLSGGEQQMLAIARGLMARPRLLLLDEPSLGLAPLIVEEVFETVATLRERGVTVCMVEQNAVAALEVADRGYVLETGELILEGGSEDLLENPEVRRAYLGKGYKEVWE